MFLIFFKIYFNKFSDFLNALKQTNIDYTLDGLARLSRSHGQTLYDIYSLRHGKCFPRISDVVVWPGMYMKLFIYDLTNNISLLFVMFFIKVNHEDVLRLVELVNQHDVVLIPFGGGTSVSGAVSCPDNEKRCIVSVDTSQMVVLIVLIYIIVTNINLH